MGCVLLIAFAVVVSISSAREFKYKEGFGIEGNLISVRGSQVGIRTYDGGITSASMFQLSDEDRDYVAQWREGQSRYDIEIGVTADIATEKKTPDGVIHGSYNYNVTVTNKGNEDLSDVEFVQSLIYVREGRNPNKQDGGKRAGIGATAAAVAKHIPAKGSHRFASEVLHLTTWLPEGKLAWRERPNGIALETYVGGKVVDVLVFVPDKPKSIGPPLAAAPRPMPEELKDFRKWVGRNGQEFMGLLIKEEGNTLHILRASDQKTLKVAKSNLSAETLAWYENVRAKAAKPAPGGGPPAPAPLVGAGIDRSTIPVLNQSDYGTKASDCVPNSYAAFFLWWDTNGIVGIPKGRDFEDKAQWIHRELAKRCVTRNNSGTYYDKAEKGLREYFERYHKGQFEIAMTSVTNITPASLAKHTVGSNATVLSLNTYRGKRIRRSNAGYHAVTLIDAKEDGRIELATWGGRLKGRIVATEEKIPKSYYVPEDAPRVIYEIIFDPDSEFPEGFLDQGYRFLLDPSQYSRLFVLSVREPGEN